MAQYIRGLLNAQNSVKLLDVLSDGSKVLPQVQQLRPDIVLVDALLQGRIKGLPLVEQIADAGYGVPVIVLTVPQNPVEVDPAKGIHGVLAMPFSGFDLMNRDRPGPQGLRDAQHDRLVARLLGLRAEGRRRQDDDRVQPGGRPRARPSSGPS